MKPDVPDLAWLAGMFMMLCFGLLWGVAIQQAIDTSSVP